MCHDEKSFGCKESTELCLEIVVTTQSRSHGRLALRAPFAVMIGHQCVSRTKNLGAGMQLEKGKRNDG